VNYLDTSALIKRFVDEPGSELVAAIVAKERPIAIAKIAYAEVHAGLARKRWEGGLSARQYARSREQFEEDWGAYVRVDLRDDILVLARDLIQRHPLRGFDAIHLASALSLRSALAEDIRFVAADTRLLQAAEVESCPVLDVEAATRR
jgi:predicted nucleic acid-binding protein